MPCRRVGRHGLWYPHLDLPGGLHTRHHITDIARFQFPYRGIIHLENPDLVSRVFIPCIDKADLVTFLRVPFMIRTFATTPRKELKIESKINACNGASSSPDGAGIRSTMAVRMSSTPFPVFRWPGSHRRSRTHQVDNLIDDLLDHGIVHIDLVDHRR